MTGLFSLLIFLLGMIIACCAGFYMGELRMREKQHILLEDSPQGDQARDEFGLHLEWATDPVLAEAELVRLCGEWKSA